MSYDMLASVWPKYLNLVHQTVFRACRYGLGTRLGMGLGTRLQKCTASIFGRVELVILTTISYQTCDFDDHYSPNMPPSLGLAGGRG